MYCKPAPGHGTKRSISWYTLLHVFLHIKAFLQFTIYFVSIFVYSVILILSVLVINLPKVELTLFFLLFIRMTFRNPSTYYKLNYSSFMAKCHSKFFYSARLHLLYVSFDCRLVPLSPVSLQQNWPDLCATPICRTICRIGRHHINVLVKIGTFAIFAPVYPPILQWSTLVSEEMKRMCEEFRFGRRGGRGRWWSTNIPRALVY